MTQNNAYRLQLTWDGEKFLLYVRSLLHGVLDSSTEILDLDFPIQTVSLTLPSGSREVECFALSPSQLLGPLLETEKELPFGADCEWMLKVALWVLSLYQDERWFPEVEGTKVGLRLLLDTSEVRQAAAHFQASMPGSLRAANPRASVRKTWADVLGLLGEALGWHLLREAPVELKERHMECLPWAYRDLLCALCSKGEVGHPDLSFFDSRQVSLSNRERVSTLAFRVIAPDGEEGSWQIRPQLQSVANPSLSCDALTAWEEPDSIPAELVAAGKSHRFHLLQEFGKALRVFPDLGASLATSPPSSLIYGPEEMAQFLAGQAGALKAYGYQLMAPESLAKPKTPQLALRLDPGATTQGGLDVNQLLEFEWNLAVDETLLDAAQLENWKEQPSPLLFSNGQWFWLDQKQTSKALRQLEKQPTEGTLLDAMRLSGGAHALHIDYSGDLAPLGGSQKFTELAEPESFEGVLRDYQRRGFSWLMFMRRLGLGACLADDMGLGKTIQTLALLTSLKDQGVFRKGLLVCPTSVLGNWQREAARFSPSLKLMLHHGDRIREPEAFEQASQEVDLVVTSYPLLTRDRKNFLPIKWDMVVLDEAQQIKNPASQASKVCRELSTAGRLILTGTPVENRLQDLWSLFRFVQPELLESRRRFQSRFARPIERLGDKEAKEQLRQLVGPFILRRTKTDPQIAAELPHKLETVVDCSLTPEQSKIYEKEVDLALKAVKGLDGFHRRGAVLRLVSRLKQLCNHPALLEEEYPTWASERSGKLHRLHEIISELPSREGVLIFSQFARMVRQLQVDLTETFGEEVLSLDGSTPRSKRDEIVERFQSGRGPRFFCISLKAGGVGLNLTRASTVVHIDRWWNPAVEAQATDRAFRIGQKRNVQVFKFVTAATLEEQIDRILQEKRALVQDLIQDGDGWLTELNDQELAQLLLPGRKSA